MALGDIAGELLSGIIRPLIHFVVDIVIEVLVKGVGYFVCRCFSKQVNPDGMLVTVVGLTTWVIFGALAMVLYEYSGAGLTPESSEVS